MAPPQTQDAVLISSFAGGRTGWAAHTNLSHDKAVPQPGPGEVIVRMRVRAIHPADTMTLMGYYPGFQPSSFPATPGHEGMGDIAALGEGVTGFTVGQRVVPLMFEYVRKGEGTWQQFVKISAHNVFPIPDAVSDDAAAQLMINPLTAYGLIRDSNVPKGEYLLQTAANSVFARQIIALARHRGIKTINIVRRSENIPELKALGADEVISSGEEDVVERVKEITGGKMAYGAIDPVGGDTTTLVASSVRVGGTVFIFGALGGHSFTAQTSDLVFRKVTLKGWWVFHFVESLADAEKPEVIGEMLGLIESGVLAPLAGEKFPLADFAKALATQHTEARAAGKTLLIG